MRRAAPSNLRESPSSSSLTRTFPSSDSLSSSDVEADNRFLQHLLGQGAVRANQQSMTYDFDDEVLCGGEEHVFALPPSDYEDDDDDDHPRMVGGVQRNPDIRRLRLEEQNGAAGDENAAVGEHFDEQYDYMLNNMMVLDRGADVDPYTYDELDPRLVYNCKEVKGYRQMMPLQARTTAIMLNNISMLVNAPTGCGKTAAFLIPAIEFVIRQKKENNRKCGGPRVLILGNTQNLMEQIVSEALSLTGSTGQQLELSMTAKIPRSTGVQVGCAIGGTSQVNPDLNKDILVGTLGRVKQLIKDQRLRLNDLQMLIVDEADVMFENANAIEIEQIVEAVPEVKQKKLIVGVYSATFSKDPRQKDVTLPEVMLKLLQINRINEDDQNSFAYVYVPAMRGYIQQRIIQLDPEFAPRSYTGRFLQPGYSSTGAEPPLLDRRISYLRMLLDQDREINYDPVTKKYKKTTIVFVKMKSRCIFLTALLKLWKYDFEPFSSDMAKDDNLSVIEQLRNGEIQGIVCTNKFARGSDVGNIDHVIVFEMSDNFADYQHRIGRTGRIGRGGISTILFSWSEDARHARDIRNFFVFHGQTLPRWLDAVKPRRSESPDVEIDVNDQPNYDHLIPGVLIPAEGCDDQEDWGEGEGVSYA